MEIEIDDWELEVLGSIQEDTWDADILEGYDYSPDTWDMGDMIDDQGETDIRDYSLLSGMSDLS